MDLSILKAWDLLSNTCVVTAPPWKICALILSLGTFILHMSHAGLAFTGICPKAVPLHLVA